jgi:hypothetical protein
MSKELVLYTHGCKNSARHHLSKYKHWAKVVTSVDTTKTNGYAFQGEFLGVTREHKLPVGSIIVEVCDTDIFAYRLTLEGKKEITKGKTKSMSAFIETVAAALAEEARKEQQGVNRIEALLRRRKELLKELALIEEELQLLTEIKKAGEELCPQS